MICKFCSQEIDDNVAFCPECGNAVAQDPAPETAEETAFTSEQFQASETAEEAAFTSEQFQAPETAEEAAFTSEQFNPSNDPAPEADTPKPKKNGKVIAIVAAVAAAVLVLVAALNWGTLLGTAVKTFGSPQDYMVFTEGKQLLEASDSVFAATADVNESTAGFNQSFDLEIPDGSLFGMSGPVNIGTDIELAVKDNLVRYLITVRYNTETLLTMECSGDVDTQDLYVSIKELNEKYIRIKGNNPQGNNSSLSLSEKDREQLVAVLKTCVTAFVKEIDQITMENDRYVVDGVEQSCTVLSLHITQAELVEACKAVLETLKDDEDLKDLYLRHGTETLYNDFCTSVQDASDSLEETLVYADTETDLMTYTSFINGKHEIIGRELAMDGEDIFSYKTAKEGATTHSQFTIGSLALKGQMTDKNGTQNGTYSLWIDNTEYCGLSVTDLNLDAFTGELRFVPTAAFYSSFGSIADVSVDNALVATLSKNDNTYAINAKAMYGEETLMTVRYTGTVLNASEVPDITLPSQENTVDGSDALALAEWCYNWSIDPFIDSLENTIPDDIISTLKTTLLSLRLNYLQDTPYYDEALTEYLEELFGGYSDWFGDYEEDLYTDFEDDYLLGDYEDDWYGDYEDDWYGDYEDDWYGDYEDDWYGDYEDLYGSL